MVVVVQVSGDEWASNLTDVNSSLLAALVAGVGISTPRVVQMGEKLLLGNLSRGTNYSVQTYRYTGWLDVAQPAMQVTPLSSFTPHSHHSIQHAFLFSVTRFLQVGHLRRNRAEPSRVQATLPRTLVHTSP